MKSVPILKLLKLLVAAIAVLAVMQLMGYNVSGILALGGVGGIVAGLAARDLLANFFGGLMIYLDKPFAVGDWIRSPDRDIEGVVEEIGWRLTLIRTLEQRPLYIPNAVFTQIAVENPSRMSNRRIYETIGIRYEDASKINLIVSDVRQMLLNHPEVDASSDLVVSFNKFSSSSLDFIVYFFTPAIKWQRFNQIRHEILLGIYNIIKQHGADIAFPSSTIYMANSK